MITGNSLSSLMCMSRPVQSTNYNPRVGCVLSFRYYDAIIRLAGPAVAADLNRDVDKNSQSCVLAVTVRPWCTNTTLRFHH